MLHSFLLFLEIMLINVVLSGDNAIVIGMASKNLPDHQRKLAIWWGAFGAIALRLVLTVVAVFLLEIPLIQAVGAFFLLYIAIKLLFDNESHSDIKGYASLGSAIRTIILADFVMSLDNVLAIAAVAENDIIIIFLGIGLSIPLIIWGSTIIVKLLTRFPILIFIGAGILGYTAGEMFVNDKKVQDLLGGLHEAYHWITPLLFTLVVIAAGLIHLQTNRKKKSNIA